MKRKNQAPSAPAEDTQTNSSGDSPLAMLLAMLDSLADALDKKAEEVENAGDSDDAESRAESLRDVSSVIRDRFAL